MILMKRRRKRQHRGRLPVMLDEGIDIQLRVEQALKEVVPHPFVVPEVVLPDKPAVLQAVATVRGRERLDERKALGVIRQLDLAAPKVLGHSFEGLGDAGL